MYNDNVKKQKDLISDHLKSLRSEIECLKEVDKKKRILMYISLGEGYLERLAASNQPLDEKGVEAYLELSSHIFKN